MLRSLNSGVSGVQNHQMKMDIVGNNIANVNTIGFKSGRGNFADTISQMLRPGQNSLTNRGSVNPVQVGLGVQLQSIANNFNQGSLESTGYATDLAIHGDGFFIVQGGDSTFYTRAGNFTLDADGRMIAGNGMGIVQGRMANETGEIENSALVDMMIPLEQKIPAKATTEVQLYSNLDADATEANASLADAGLTGVSAVNGIAADGLGGTHDITISGSQPIASSVNGTAVVGMDLTTPLVDVGGVGLTTVGDITITVDEGTDSESQVTITGLDENSTVGDFLSQLNTQVTGVEFALDTSGDPNNFISATRTYAGAGAEYNFRMTDGGTSTVINDLFAAGDLLVDTGVASSLVATDIFTDDATGTQITSTLTFSADPVTGLMIEMQGVGGGGVSVLAPDGFVPGDLAIQTEATEHSTSISVYDEKGDTHNLTLTFTKTAIDNEWMWEAGVVEPAVPITGATGIVSFNTDGSLRNWSFDDEGSEFSFDPGDGTSPVTLSFDAGDFNGMNGITQTAAGFSTAAVGQDGYAMGTLSDIDINYDGSIIGNFTNGNELLLGELVLADFTNLNGLEKAGNNMWTASEVSGDPRFSSASNGMQSSIEAGRLEMSNVDLVKEFTEMIKAQRGFQANSRVITVSDQILQDVMMMKR
jgi:flagellar hook protein FlgE